MQAMYDACKNNPHFNAESYYRVTAAMAELHTATKTQSGEEILGDQRALLLERAKKFEGRPDLFWIAKAVAVLLLA